MTPSERSEIAGGCLCGAVRFSGRLSDRRVMACHCGQCRRWSGHVWAAAGAAELDVAGPVRWFRSSDAAERGFCPTCGSSLFWRKVGETQVDVAPGCLDDASALRLAGHIYVDDKGSYYDITDDLPQYPGESGA